MRKVKSWGHLVQHSYIASEIFPIESTEVIYTLLLHLRDDVPVHWWRINCAYTLAISVCIQPQPFRSSTPQDKNISDPSAIFTTPTRSLAHPHYLTASSLVCGALTRHRSTRISPGEKSTIVSLELSPRNTRHTRTPCSQTPSNPLPPTSPPTTSSLPNQPPTAAHGESTTQKRRKRTKPSLSGFLSGNRLSRAAAPAMVSRSVVVVAPGMASRPHRTKLWRG